VSSERQVALQVQLSDFQSQVVKQSADAAEQLERLRNDVLGAVENTLRRAPPADSGSGEGMDISDQLQLIRAIRDSLDGLLQSRTGPSPEIRILKQLHFGSLHRREDEMAPADVDTFEWLLAGPTVQHPGSTEESDDGESSDDEKNPDDEDGSHDKEDTDDEDDLSDEEKREASPREAAAARFPHWLREEDTDDEDDLSDEEKREASQREAAAARFPHWLREEDTDDEDDLSGGEKREASQREAAAARFLHWLREENGVFHISGKPGSGKSTLMKLLLRDERTKQELKEWAGGSQLVFAHFFFWLSGERLQHSLEGLYRSILFEILIQCPELIPNIFPRAYRSFSKANADESIDELFFRPGDIQKAFTDLMTRSPQPGYRFCLFIDGLDEYGGESVSELDHQRLADALVTWAAHRDVKILASSRPHRQFEDTFSDERRICLHELTRSDIVLAGRQMFEKDKSFARPEVQACYASLVNKVAYRAEGVFLWASLAIRSLLNAVGRYDPIDSLEEHLNGIPRNVDKLYEKMFLSIDPVDRARAFKLLLLVAEVPVDIMRLNALSITWLQDLEDVNFPMKCEFKPYTEEQIRQRHLEASYQVDSLTKGLLEIVGSDKRRLGEPLFWRKRVQFFHRTVRDFVRQSSDLQKFASNVPDLTNISTYARLLLAELHFASTNDIQGYYRDRQYSLILYYYGDCHPDGLLDGYGRAMEHHNSESSVRAPAFPGVTTRLEHAPGGGANQSTLSFLHFLASYGIAGYVQRKVAADAGLLRPQGCTSLLLSAAVMSTSPAMAKALLDAGASPHDLVWSYDRRSQFTVWQLVCTAFVCQMMRPDSRVRFLRRNCEIIQYFLEAGADANCFALLSCEADSPVSPGPTHAIALRTLIQQCNPPNLDELLRLMEGPKPSQGTLLVGVFHSAWKYLTGKAGPVAPTFRLEDYAPFDLAMDPYLLTNDIGVLPRFVLKSVVFNGETQVDRDVEIQCG
jgi:hypothetical protein